MQKEYLVKLNTMWFLLCVAGMTMMAGCSHPDLGSKPAPGAVAQFKMKPQSAGGGGAMATPPAKP